MSGHKKNRSRSSLKAAAFPKQDPSLMGNLALQQSLSEIFDQFTEIISTELRCLGKSENASSELEPDIGRPDFLRLNQR